MTDENEMYCEHADAIGEDGYCPICDAEWGVDEAARSEAQETRRVEASHPNPLRREPDAPNLLKRNEGHSKSGSVYHGPIPGPDTPSAQASRPKNDGENLASPDQSKDPLPHPDILRLIEAAEEMSAFLDSDAFVAFDGLDAADSHEADALRAALSSPAIQEIRRGK